MTITNKFISFPKFLLAVFIGLFTFVSLFFAHPANAASVNINNNSNWYDTSGNQIWAQGGWIMKSGSTYYWYGMDYSVPNTNNIKLYTSTDLKNWTKYGNVATLSGLPNYSGTQWIGRPLVAYNSSTSKYVMIMEWNSDVTRNKLTFFTSSSPTGPFTYSNYIEKPSGYTMGDLGSIFTDSSGTYITYTSDYPAGYNGSIKINKLASDFLSIAEDTKTLMTGNKEASSLIKKGSNYLLFLSDTNGWSSSGTSVYKATSLSGTWSWGYYVTTSPSSSNSYDTQVDQILPVSGTSGTSYVYLGDRWNNMGGSSGIGRNQWFPVSFDSNDWPTINGYTSWNIDAAAGTWSTASTTIDTSKTYSIINRNSGKSLNVVGGSLADGANIEQWSYGGWDSQKFQFIDAGGGYYKIKNVASGKLLDISGASTADGANNVQWYDTGGWNQQWQLIDAGYGYIKIKNRNSGKLLDINGASWSDGALNIQWYDNGGWNQHWSLGIL